MPKSHVSLLGLDGVFTRDGFGLLEDNIPSSGVMVRVKLRASEGSGNVVFIVLGSSNSVKSEYRHISDDR